MTSPKVVPASPRNKIIFYLSPPLSLLWSFLCTATNTGLEMQEDVLRETRVSIDLNGYTV